MQLFVSDIHLCPTRPQTASAFRRFLAGEARGASALYILGDLFDYWAGDDDLDDPFNREIVSAIRQLALDVPVSFIAGNRDFLIDSAFAAAANLRLLPDMTVIHIGGKRTLLLHGDTLCTDDHAYLAFRSEVRTRQWSDTFLSRPLDERKADIEALRRASEAAKRDKPSAIMDVNADAVAAALRDHNCRRMIHGHTHRPGHHLFQVDGDRCERWVLAEWHDGGQYLAADSARIRSLSLPAE